MKVIVDVTEDMGFNAKKKIAAHLKSPTKYLTRKKTTNFPLKPKRLTSVSYELRKITSAATIELDGICSRAP